MGKKKTPAEEEKVMEKPLVDPEDDEEEGPMVAELKAIDDRCLEVEKRFRREVEELRKKFAAEQVPILAERKDFLAKLAEGAEAKPDDGGTPALPGFWFQAISNHPAFEDMIEEWDEAVLQHVTDVTRSYVDEADPMKGFSLNFHFAENPFFKHAVLSKTYKTTEGAPWTTGIEATDIEATEIEWNPGNDVTVQVVKKKPNKGGAKKKASSGKEEPRDSFFRSFFRSLKLGGPIPEDLNISEARVLCGDEDGDGAMMKLILENEYGMACAIRDELIPFAVRFYTGEALPQHEMDDDEDDEDDEEEDDDEEEEEEEEPPPPAKGKKQQPGKKKGPAPQQQECKQQ